METTTTESKTQIFTDLDGSEHIVLPGSTGHVYKCGCGELRSGLDRKGTDCWQCGEEYVFIRETTEADEPEQDEDGWAESIEEE